MPGFDKMIGLISALAQIQSQRRQLDLQEAEFTEGKSRFAQQMGFQEKSEQFKKASQLLDMIAKSSSESRKGLYDLGKLQGMSEQEVQALTQFGMNAPESLEILKQRGAAQGLQAGATPMQQEIASSNLTGQNMGQQALSQFQNALAGGAQGQLTPQMMQSFAERSASGQNPLQALVAQNIMQNPNMVKRMAEMGSGTGLSAEAQANLDLGNRNAATAEAGVRQRLTEVEQQTAARLAEISASGKGGMTPQALIDGQRLMNDQLRIIGDPKVAQAIRDKAMAQYNVTAQLLGLDLLTCEKLGVRPPGTVERLQNKVVPPQPGQPLYNQNPLQNFIPPTNPGYTYQPPTRP